MGSIIQMFPQTEEPVESPTKWAIPRAEVVNIMHSIKECGPMGEELTRAMVEGFLPSGHNKKGRLPGWITPGMAAECLITIGGFAAQNTAYECLLRYERGEPEATQEELDHWHKLISTEIVERL